MKRRHEVSAETKAIDQQRLSSTSSAKLYTALKPVFQTKDVHKSVSPTYHGI